MLYVTADFIPACVIVLAWKDTLVPFWCCYCFSPCQYPRGICSDPWTVAQRPGWETGPTTDSCVVVGKVVCISELCFLISKMTIAVFVRLSQLGGAKVEQCVKEHGLLERTIFFWNFFGFENIFKL